MAGRRSRGLLILAGSMLVASQTGCTTLVKRAYYEVRGAKVTVLPAQESVDRTDIVERFAAYQSFLFAPATTTLGAQMCPPRVLTAFDTEAANLPTDEKRGEDLGAQYPGGEPTLAISTDIQFVESKGLLGAALLFARVKFTDGDKMVLDAVVMTKSNSFREGGREELATETAKGIGEFLVTAKTGEKGLDEMLP